MTERQSYLAELRAQPPLLRARIKRLSSFRGSCLTLIPWCVAAAVRSAHLVAGGGRQATALREASVCVYTAALLHAAYWHH